MQDHAEISGPAEQAAVERFLSRAENYSLPGAPVERIETHCSLIFLVGEHAFKLKRAIVFSSLDYRTVAQRERACRAEIALNQGAAPDIYLGVRAINRGPDGTLAFDGPGPAVDWVVVMRRFAQENLFSAMAETGRLTPELMRQLGAEIARLHQAAVITPGFGGCAGIEAAIENNRRELLRVGHLLDGAGLDALHAQTAAEFLRVAGLLDQRRALGRVRRCHGDLRLANICLFNGRPTLFDSIEFSDDIGCIDVLYDLAFLLMDLLVGGMTDLANEVFNSYLDHTGETAGLRALPLFLAVRAATRSYALAGGATRHPDRAAAQLAAARAHLHASVFFLRPAPPRLLVVADRQGGAQGGPAADFSASLAPRLRPVPGARLLRITMPDATDRIFAETVSVLAAGCTVLVQGDFSAARERQAVAAVARATQVPFLGLWLDAPPADLERGLWHCLPPGAGAPAAVEMAELLLTSINARPGETWHERKSDVP